MKKKLPSIKKSLIDFATKEDAKVMDKAFTKVALIGTAISFGVLDNVYGLLGSSSDHYNHANHTNYLSVPGENLNDETYPNPTSNPNNFHKSGADGGLDDFHAAYNKENIVFELFNPNNSPRLAPLGLLPSDMGWRPSHFTSTSLTIDVPAKSVVAHHANHYNTISETHGGW